MNDWYKPNTSKKNNTVFVLTIVIIILVLILAGTVIFILLNGVNAKNEQPVSFTTSNENLPDNFNDFLNSYYTEVKSEDAVIDIPKCEYKIDFSMDIDSDLPKRISLQDLYKNCTPWIVSVSASEDGQNYRYWGSGIIISSDGLILTNTHIIDGCSAAYVQLYDKSRYEVSLVAADAISDIALLKIEPENDLDFAKFGDSSILNVGDDVAAIGSPLGETFRNTLSNGIISAIERDISYNGHAMTLIQTNTALNEGNSGGALFNMYGQVIGITNMKMMSYYSSIEGIAFAIPSSNIRDIINNLLEYGLVKRTSIGITVGSIPENILKHYGLPKGLYISEVTEGSGADIAGIEKGDILVSVEGNEVSNIIDINTIKDKLKPGDTMILTIFRDGQNIDFNVILSD